MRVQRVWMPDSGAESWTVLGDDHAPVAPVERWLAYLTLIERSPNTIKGYAHDLKDWFGFLQLHRLDWRSVQAELRRLREENRQLREQLAWALGEHRVAQTRGQPVTPLGDRSGSARPIGPCS